MTLMPLSTVSKTGISRRLSAGSPTITRRPLGFSAAWAARIACGRGHRDQGDVDAADGRQLGGLVTAGVDDVVGSEVLGQLQLGVVDVDGHGGGAEDLGVLQAEVAQAADAHDHGGLAGLRVGDLERLVRRDAGARQRCGVEGADAVGHAHDVARRMPTAYSA